MLEVFLVLALCVAVGKLVREKGRKPFWVQFLLVVCWVLGEFVGGFLASVLHRSILGPDQPWGVWVYLSAIAGGLAGALLSFVFAISLPDQLPRTISQRTTS